MSASSNIVAIEAEIGRFLQPPCLTSLPSPSVQPGSPARPMRHYRILRASHSGSPSAAREVRLCACCRGCNRHDPSRHENSMSRPQLVDHHRHAQGPLRQAGFREKATLQQLDVLTVAEPVIRIIPAIRHSPVILVRYWQGCRSPAHSHRQWSSRWFDRGQSWQARTDCKRILAAVACRTRPMPGWARRPPPSENIAGHRHRRLRRCASRTGTRHNGQDNGSETRRS